MARIGWSIGDNRYQVGESTFSYAYQSDGKRCTDNEFTEYSSGFTVGDIITAYLVSFSLHVATIFYNNVSLN